MATVGVMPANSVGAGLLGPAAAAAAAAVGSATAPGAAGVSEKRLIRDVWAHNLEDEMAAMRELVDRYPYLSMDTEFPGVVARPVGNFKSPSDYQYQSLRCNVDMLKIIQLGLTFSDEHGNIPPGTCTWQLHFQFNLHEDMYAQESIDLLKKSGINFDELATHGIDFQHFGELLISSGFVLLDNVKWIAFQGTYDFGYLLKLVTCEALPEDELQFHELLHLYFPCIYDIKYLMKSCKNLRGGLQEVADSLAVERIGPQHQAGSDSLLSAFTFFKMRKLFFDNNIDDSKYLGQVYGLGNSYVTPIHTNGRGTPNATTPISSAAPTPPPGLGASWKAPSSAGANNGNGRYASYDNDGAYGNTGH